MAVLLLAQDAYDRTQIKSALSDALAQWGGIEQLLAGKQRIVLKPNFVVPEVAEHAATTHPEFYLAVAELLLDHGKQVTIGESPAFGSAEQAVTMHGAREECQRLGVQVMTFRQAAEITCVAGSSSYRSLTIAAELADFDAMINLPKLKVHQQFVFTAATKNLYGCVTGKRKFVRHNLCRNDPTMFARMLLQNAAAAAPVLNIGDGIVAMHVKGPRGGKPFPLQRIVVSDCYLEHDWVAARLIGLKAAETPLFAALSVAERRQLADNCQETLADPLAAPAKGFRQSYRVPISFAPHQFARTLWRSCLFRLRELRRQAGETS